MEASQRNSETESSALDLSVTVVSSHVTAGRGLARQLREVLNGLIELDVAFSSDIHVAAKNNILFVDSGCPQLDDVLSKIDRDRSSVFLIVREGDPVPAAWIEDRVDEVLVHPFRATEVLGKLRYFQKMQEWREMVAVNHSYAQLVERLQGSLQISERLQKSKLPTRFPEVKGFKVTSRYLAGMRPGGDYVDLAESRDGQQLAILMSDSSNYRLSSAMLDTVTRVMSQLSVDETRSCITTARRVRDGVLVTMSEKDRLSLFYAVMSRKDYRLRYLNLGSSQLFYAPPGKPFAHHPAQGDAILRATGVRVEKENELALEPSGRLALVSAGYVDAMGGVEAVMEILNRFRDKIAADSLNELVYRVKAKLTEPDDLPVRDCTAVIFDVDSKLLRLA